MVETRKEIRAIGADKLAAVVEVLRWHGGSATVTLATSGADDGPRTVSITEVTLNQTGAAPPPTATKIAADAGQVMARAAVEAASRKRRGEAYQLAAQILGCYVGSCPVGAIVTDASAYALHHADLERAGIAMTDQRSGPRRPHLEGKRFIFFDIDKVKRLVGSKWTRDQYEDLLLTLPGAARAQRMLSRRRTWGIEMPSTKLLEHLEWLPRPIAADVENDAVAATEVWDGTTPGWLDDAYVADWYRRHPGAA